MKENRCAVLQMISDLSKCDTELSTTVNCMTTDSDNPDTLCKQKNFQSQGFLRLQISYSICHFIRECLGPAVGDREAMVSGLVCHHTQLGISCLCTHASIHIHKSFPSISLLCSCNLHWHSGNIVNGKRPGVLKRFSSSSPPPDIFLVSSLCF